MLEILVRASFEGAVLVALIWAVCRFLPRLSPATRTVLWWCPAGVRAAAAWPRSVADAHEPRGGRCVMVIFNSQAEDCHAR
jgi:hypothetical protein